MTFTIITFNYNYSGSYGDYGSILTYYYDNDSANHDNFRNAGLLKMYIGKADFNASSLQKNQILTYDFSSIMGFSSSEAQNSANTLRDESMKLFNQFLKNRTGMTMNDIGFTSYDLS